MCASPTRADDSPPNPAPPGAWQGRRQGRNAEADANSHETVSGGSGKGALPHPQQQWPAGVLARGWSTRRRFMPMTQKPKVASSLGMNFRGAMPCVSTRALATSWLNTYLWPQAVEKTQCGQKAGGAVGLQLPRCTRTCTRTESCSHAIAGGLHSLMPLASKVVLPPKMNDRHLLQHVFQGTGHIASIGSVTLAPSFRFFPFLPFSIAHVRRVSSQDPCQAHTLRPSCRARTRAAP